jgi:D-psicose/D-tagatose/L-ribulose 3-epimerase
VGPELRNRFGVYYAFLCDDSGIDWKDCIRRTAEAGFGVTELSAVQFRDKPRLYCNEIASYVKEFNLGLSFATGLSADTDVSSDDESVRRAGIETLKNDISLCADMGGTKIGGIVYGVHKNLPPGAAFYRDKLFERGVNAVREAAKTAADYGVTLTVEIVNRFESVILNTAEEGVSFIKAVDNPAAGLHLDTFHMNIEEDDLPEAIRTAGKYLKHVHFCENNRKLPGNGHIDWNSVKEALLEIGYDDTIVIESLPFPYGTVSDRLNIWRNLLNKDVDSDLAQAAIFLKKLFKDY